MGSYISYTYPDFEDRESLDLRWCQILSNAPIDIARLILEYAAQNDRATAVSISLVSKEVNAWVTPILFRTVEFRSCAHIEKAEEGYASLRHTRTLVLLDTEQYLENGLYTFRIPDPELLHNSCPDLFELHISENTSFDLGNSSSFLCTLP
ncbi:hypothetical protein C8R41DRAFT_818396 [Lentinula lateritia]|uniref:F-box domain-containing protein n=1 Tax=Lentinula lateritia TaxID=40482 RepID=A0ABQ8VTK2_9AGAR|nr:hypothetical protein C8R41DRAFT_818396 [Lentinula lateritia]